MSNPVNTPSEAVSFTPGPLSIEPFCTPERDDDPLGVFEVQPWHDELSAAYFGIAESDLVNTDPDRELKELDAIHAKNSAFAAELLHRFNSHDELLSALTDCEMVLTAIECGHDKPLSAGMVLDRVRAAIRKATP